MIVKIQDLKTDRGSQIVVTCPACRKEGTFDSIGNLEDLFVNDSLCLGQRQCPNLLCKAHLFFIYNFRTNDLHTYPPTMIDFSTENIPERIRMTFEEAITCHANSCFVAAAMMVRKTLEELCLDKSAKGDNLQKRIGALRDKVIIPDELLSGMDDLRLLGNDAAHIESREFEKVGKEEVEIAIEFTKEVLKAVYQYSHLLNRIRSLKRGKVLDE